MTFEMAMAQAFLTVFIMTGQHASWPKAAKFMRVDLAERTLAMRRLRVRAGLKP